MRLTTDRIVIPNIIIEVTTEKNVAAPLSFFELLETITQPFASAKSAIDQMKNQTVMIAEIT